MPSRYSFINERAGEPFQTEPLAGVIKRDLGAVDRLALIAAVLRTHFLTGGWEFRVHNGSLTFQNRRNKHQLVKIFIDAGDRLAAKAGVYQGKEPVAVGIELTHEEPFVRECVRDRLSALFGEAYLDPRRPRADSLAIVRNDKYWIIPHANHYCDIIFVKDTAEIGRQFFVEPQIVAQFARKIRKGLRIAD